MIGSIKTDINLDFDNIKNNENSKIQNKSNNQKYKLSKNGQVNIDNSVTNNNIDQLKIYQGSQELTILEKRKQNILEKISNCNECQGIKESRKLELEIIKDFLLLNKGWYNSKQQDQYFRFKNGLDMVTCNKHKDLFEEYNWINKEIEKNRN